MNTVICSKGHKVSLGAMFCQQCGDPLQKVESKTAETNPSENGLEQLPPGTRLRDRYLIQQQLGQGGFGRTYLAEDTGRFHERIAIKEFFPTVQGTQALQKAEELFQREAVTLHKLQHPQIPRFWETFREGKRLFLVEDFIEGKTYQFLLDQRLRQGQRFNEAEILKLFRELLPVLSYLHRQGVIHRDISPDNIMLRDQDKQVVLIDMDGVKQVVINVATQVVGRQNRAGSSEATCLGKVGYAPDEQLRLGIVAPHSDLYALAVTAIVLMTGKQPQDLLDQNTMNWMWHQELMLNPVLTKIINRMLNRQPSQRFKSADEILQLLQANPSGRTHAATKPTEVQVSAPVSNSGKGSKLDTSIKVPDEIKGWNWAISGCLFIAIVSIPKIARIFYFHQKPEPQRVESVAPSPSVSPSSTGQPTEVYPSNESIELPKDYNWVAAGRSVKGDELYFDRNSLTSNGENIRFWYQHVSREKMKLLTKLIFRLIVLLGLIRPKNFWYMKKAYWFITANLKTIQLIQQKLVRL